jgi:hypothetical protein
MESGTETGTRTGTRTGTLHLAKPSTEGQERSIRDWLQCLFLLQQLSRGAGSIGPKVRAEDAKEGSDAVPPLLPGQGYQPALLQRPVSIHTLFPYLITYHFRVSGEAPPAFYNVRNENVHGPQTRDQRQTWWDPTIEDGAEDGQQQGPGASEPWTGYSGNQRINGGSNGGGQRNGVCPWDQLSNRCRSTTSCVRGFWIYFDPACSAPDPAIFTCTKKAFSHRNMQCHPCCLQMGTSLPQCNQL